VLASWATERDRVTLTLPGEAHVYDVLSGEYLGKSRTVARTVQPGRVQLLAALPYRVEGVEVTAPAEVAQGEELAYRAEVIRDAERGAPVTHVFRVELFGPAGRRAPAYGSNVTAADGRADASLALALNDAPGAWRLLVRDVATGTSGEALFTVRESGKQR
jgi:hypothetical protein